MINSLDNGPGFVDDLDLMDIEEPDGPDTVTSSSRVSSYTVQISRMVECFLPPDAPPPPSDESPANTDWSPWENGLEFRTANLLYRRMQASAGHIDELMEIVTALSEEGGTESLFADAKDLYSIIDACESGSVPWQAFSVSYDGPRVAGKIEPWMDKEFVVYYRDPREVLHRQLGNRDFAGEIETTPYQATSRLEGKRQFQNFMLGNWAMREADTIQRDHPSASDGAMLCPVIVGSDKTTVSVATGQNDYYPVYLSNGNLMNNARRSHRGGVSLFMFLAIPKTDRSHQDSAEFRRFRRHLFHQSLRHVFEHLRPYMTEPDTVRLADGYYRRVIYSLGPYIGDYPEQVLLACIVQGWCTAEHDDLNGPGIPRSHDHTRLARDAFPNPTKQWDKFGIIAGIMPFTSHFPRADIHTLIAPDILHQLVKGTFKDHLVTWVQEYLEMHSDSKAEAARIMAEIDRRIAAAPLFPGLRRFPEGQGFKQWTGNDSKALMKVYLPAIAGLVPNEVVWTLAAFIEVCYLIRRDVHTEDTITTISDQIKIFQTERVIFQELEVRDTFSLPRQHSLLHYPQLIAEFRSPNGLCSSITESKHISVVKEPWWQSSRNQPLSEMLVINDRMDKMEWAEVDFHHRGMLAGPATLGVVEDFSLQAIIYAEELAELLRVLAANPFDDEDDDGGPIDGKNIPSRVRLARKHITGLPRHPADLEHRLHLKNFTYLVQCFLYEQNLSPEDRPQSSEQWADHEDSLPSPNSQTKVWIYPSAVATFSAPSDLCGFGGMKRERIRAVISWKGGPARQDCVFVIHDLNLPGFRGLEVAQIQHFLRIRHDHETYLCALVKWFSTRGIEPDPLTGLWVVTPDEDEDGDRQMDIIDLDAILRGAHLIGVAGKEWLPTDFTYTDTLDDFTAFYVNKLNYHDGYLDSQTDLLDWMSSIYDRAGVSVYATPRKQKNNGKPTLESPLQIKSAPNAAKKTEKGGPSTAQKTGGKPEPLDSKMRLVTSEDKQVMDLRTHLNLAQATITNLESKLCKANRESNESITSARVQEAEVERLKRKIDKLNAEI
ncbi:hypothetical protein V5O48_008750, partial [Marasmius crinis-equi]